MAAGIGSSVCEGYGDLAREMKGSSGLPNHRSHSSIGAFSRSAAFKVPPVAIASKRISVVVARSGVDRPWQTALPCAKASVDRP